MTTSTKTDMPLIETGSSVVQQRGKNRWDAARLYKAGYAGLTISNGNARINFTLPSDYKKSDETTTDTSGATKPEQPTSSEQHENLPQPTASTYTRPAFEQDKVLPGYRKKLIEIFEFGAKLNENAKEYQGKIQEKAINGLAKILGVRRMYFDETTPEVSRILFDELYEQCVNQGLKGRNKQTTEFHLLSKLLRQSDRKQASADAKVLIRAHNEKQTEKTFPNWVKNLGGLNNIRTEINNFENGVKQEKEQKKKSANKHKGNLKTLFDTAREASWTPLTSFSFEKSPKELKELIPSEGTWLPIAIARRDGKVTFYIPKKDSCVSELNPDLTEHTDFGNKSSIDAASSSQH